MNPLLRRLLIFVALAGGGVFVLVLLSEEDKRITTRVNRLDDVVGSDGMVIESTAGEAVKIRFEETEFDILEPVEVSPGVFENRAVYRLHMVTGGPGEDSTFEALQPRLEFLDTATGLPTGDYIESAHAVFYLEESVAGDVRVDPTALSAEHFTLTGDVRARLPTSSGPSADLEADAIDVDGPRIVAYGLVKWSRPDVSVEGLNMTWDETSGRLGFERDARLAMSGTADRGGWELFAPGGLTGVIPPGSTDPVKHSTWELRGMVTGTGPGGTRIGAHTAWFDGPASTVTLDGESVLEQDDGEDLVRVEASHLTVQQTEDGRVALAEANGNVHLLSEPFAILPAWMIGESVTMKGSHVSSPDASSWTSEGVTTTGEGMTYDRETGVLEFDREAEVAVEEGDLTGLRLTAPGGMTWTVPPRASDAAADAVGQLRGQVTGRLPDGSEFSSDVLLFEGPDRRYTLEGDVEIRRSVGVADQRLSARHVVVSTDEGGRLAALSATGDVVLLSSIVHVLPTRIETQRLDIEGQVARSPELVSWHRGDMLVVGKGMRYSEAEGRLDLDQDARIRVFEARGAASTGDAPPAGDAATTSEIDASQGLTWNFPPGSLRPLADGSGELRGLVRGRTADGLELQAEKLLLDGPTGHAVLLGAAVVDFGPLDDRTHLSSDHVDVSLSDGERILRTDRPAQFSSGRLSGSSDSLELVETTGAVTLGANPSLRVLDAAGAISLVLDATAGLTGILPPGADDAEAASSWHVIGDVEALLADGTRVEADEVKLARGGQDITLLGRSRYGRDDDQGGRALSATGGIRVQRDTAGALLWFSADGQVEGTSWSTGVGAARLRFAGDSAIMDRAGGVTTLSGESVIERSLGGATSRIRANRSLVVLSDADDRFLRVDAEGEVRCNVGEYETRSDSLAWDLEADLAILDGNCMLLAMGMWVPARQVILRPEAKTFEIKGRELHVDDAR